MNKIPFNKPHLTGQELRNIEKAHELGQFSGDGFHTKKCNQWFLDHYGTRVLLTHSCTAALEMSAFLAHIGPGDEVIMPSYTFVSTANAVVLRGGVPVFVDIDPLTLNLSLDEVEKAVSPRTKALMVVHYAGMCCDMDRAKEIASRHKILLLEDAAQAFNSTFKGRLLGTIGDMGALSFHETKNVISGEGGALLVNNPEFYERAEIIREKGTNRSLFFRGQVDKYTWVDIGSSYLPGEIVAAFLSAQLEHSNEICKKRVDIWNVYHMAFEALELSGRVRRPSVPEHCNHNGHLYYLLVESLELRTRLIAFLKEKGVSVVFHYVPLHSAPAGKKYARSVGSLAVTDDIADRLVRLPLYFDIADMEIQFVIECIHDFFGAN